MKVKFSPRASRRVKIVARWWRENRPTAPTVFDEELRAVIERLKSEPNLGSKYEVLGGKLIRRTLLSKRAQNVYYAVDDEAAVIVIHTVWGARRGRAPSSRRLERCCCRMR